MNAVHPQAAPELPGWFLSQLPLQAWGILHAPRPFPTSQIPAGHSVCADAAGGSSLCYLTHGPAPSRAAARKSLKWSSMQSPAYREAPPEELGASQRSPRKTDPLTIIRKSFVASDLSPSCGHQNDACCCLLLGGNMTEGRQEMGPGLGWTPGSVTDSVTLCSVPNFSGSQFYGF